MPIDIGKFKGAKKLPCNQGQPGAGLKVNKVNGKLTINCLRPGPEDSIIVVFADKGEANQAKQHTRWLTLSMPGTRIKGEHW